MWKQEEPQGCHGKMVVEEELSVSKDKCFPTNIVNPSKIEALSSRTRDDILIIRSIFTPIQ